MIIRIPTTIPMNTNRMFSRFRLTPLVLFSFRASVSVMLFLLCGVGIIILVYGYHSKGGII
jgi:hypothetical protein